MSYRNLKITYEIDSIGRLENRALNVYRKNIAKKGTARACLTSSRVFILNILVA